MSEVTEQEINIAAKTFYENLRGGGVLIKKWEDAGEWAKEDLKDRMKYVLRTVTLMREILERESTFMN